VHNSERGTPPQARRQVEQTLSGQAGTGPGNLLAPLEQAQAVLCERIVATGEADDGPGVARREWPAAAAAGDRPALDARAVERSIRSVCSSPSVPGTATRSPERSSA